jgi:hypothetical protein
MRLVTEDREDREEVMEEVVVMEEVAVMVDITQKLLRSLLMFQAMNITLMSTLKDTLKTIK